jgi:galactose mutarotase-like enzyme
MERKHKPSAIPMSPAMPQPIIDLTNNVLTASLPSRDSVTINLYGATVTSWKLSNGSEKIFLSESAILDGSKPIRGGIPLVFPVFGPPPKEGHATSKLPQHGFARNNYWEFLGSSRSENMAGKRGAGSSVKLDFGLGSGSLSEETKSKWPYEFGLVYSVELGSGTLETSMHVTNTGKESFDFQCLFHTYFRIKVRTTRFPPLYKLTGHFRTSPKPQYRASNPPPSSTKSAKQRPSPKTPPPSPSPQKQTASTAHQTPRTVPLSQSRSTRTESHPSQSHETLSQM